MMKARKLVGRLAVAAVLVGMMVVLTAAPAFPAQPEAGTISTGSGVQVWNGHSCPADVPVNIAGLSAGLGGYETKVGWDPARFSSADADIAISLTPYLTNGGTRQQTGDSSTPALKAVSSGAVKYGAYSWGTGNPPGNMANGQLSTVSIKPTATCGSAALTLAETQLVDISGNLIALTAQTGSSVAVFSRYDTNGVQSTINAVMSTPWWLVGSGQCHVAVTTSIIPTWSSTINAGDVTAVVAKLVDHAAVRELA